MAKISDPLPDCPACAAGPAVVAEDVSDEVTVLRCPHCGQTWAVRSD